jgi:hypothetical protein
MSVPGAGAPAVPTVPGAGRPLDLDTRSLWEGRFGHAFERVRIHTGREADEAARAYGARAYTFQHHVVFRHGEYAPGTSAGAELLAHELAHVVQQGGGIQREPSADDLAAFDSLITEIHGWNTYTKLEADQKAMADAIVADARVRDNALYYARKLYLLFKIPSPKALSPAEAAQVEQETIAMNRGSIEDSIKEETKLAAEPGYQKGVEEAASEERDRTNKWETRQGDGATYRVDVSDYNNIVVQLKLHLVPRPRSKTTAGDIEKMGQIEQGVERAAARVGGYIFDLQFRNAGGPDVFTVAVDIGEWPTSGNIVGGADVLVHEVHHRLRLPDRYDYIEAHAENDAMSVPQRLRLFQRQMTRGITDPLAPYSLMDEGGPDRRLTDEDVCLAADPEHAEACIAKRNSTGLELIRLRAWSEAVRAWNGLVDVIAGGNPPASANVQRLAELIFHEPVAAGDLASRVVSVAARLGVDLRFNMVLSTPPGALQEKPGFANRGNPKCQKVPLWANVVDVVSGAGGGGTQGASSISICSHALMAEDEKCLTQSMLAAAAEMTGLAPFVGSGCPHYECTQPSGAGVQSADSWAQFIYCFNRTRGGGA